MGERHTKDGDALLLAMLKQKLADGAQQAAEFVQGSFGVQPTMDTLTRFHTGYDPDTGVDLTKLPLLPNPDTPSRMGEIGAWLGLTHARNPARSVTHLSTAGGPVPRAAGQEGMGPADTYQAMMTSEDPEARKRALVVYALRGGT